MKSKHLVRTRFLASLILIFGLLLIGKLYIVQIVRGDAFSEKALRQYARPGATAYDRGSIFFATKDGNLIGAATLRLGYILAINPSAVEEPALAYDKLSALYPLDKSEFLAKASKQDDPYEEVGRRLPQEAADKIAALKIPGVAVYKERWRVYPGGTSAAHTLGFVGWNGDQYGGRYGLERYYDDVLSRDDESLYVNFFAELFSNVSTIVNGTPRKGDIVASIEPTVQTFLDKEIEKISTRWKTTQAGGIVIDPKTGAIHAFSVYPVFDPNNLENVKPDILLNPLVEGVYEMGSILKPLTIAAGIDAGAITAQSTYTDHGFLTVDTATIRNFDGKGRGTVSMQTVLDESLNTGVAHVVQKMGIEKFSTYMKNYGLGEETGIDLPGEVRGLVSNLDSTRQIEHITASFGQGIAITPIAAVRALSALANKGVLPNPHIADRILQKGAPAKKLSYGEGKRVISEKTAEEVTRMLVAVVDEALLDGKVKMDRYSIAAKTGTAQIANASGGGYYEDRFLHSFFGYFPAYNPRFLVFLYAVWPKGEQYASRTLTEPFMSTTKFLINYYEIPPDR